MVPQGREFRLQTLRDLEKRGIGGQLGFRYPALRGLDVNILRARSYKVNIQRVASGRIDGALIGSITGPYTVAKLRLNNHVTFLPNAIDVVHLGSALSTQAFSKSMRKKFDSEIARILAGKRWKKIRKANNVLQHQKDWPLIKPRRHSDALRTR